MKLRTIVAAAAAPLALGSLLLTTAGAASATASSGPGSWQFLTFDPNWSFTDGIKTTGGGSPTTQYQAQVQPPINAPGQIPSVFSNKTRTIPVKYKVQSRTCTPGKTTVYPDTLQSYADPSVVATNLYWNAPAGLTVGQISNLTADFSWAQGANHGGGFRWQIDTASGVTIYVYYGDIAGSGTYTGTSGSGANMMAATDARFEQQGGSPQYTTLADVLARTAPAGGTIADQPVQDVGLVLDGGWGGAQKVTLTDATIGTATGTSTYIPGTVSTDPSCTAWAAADTSKPAYLYLAKVSGNAPAQPIDEALITSTQGDTGGQFRVADGMYIYNLPLSQLTGLTAQYQVGISFSPDGSNPLPVPVQFGLR